MLPRPPISTRPVALLPFATLYRSHVGHQVAQGAEAGEDALDVGIEVGEEALRLGGVGGTPRTTGRRGRRVGGRVELGRTELVGRGIGSAPTKIGRAHVGTSVTNAQLVCRLQLEK